MLKGEECVCVWVCVNEQLLSIRFVLCEETHKQHLSIYV